MEKMPTFYGQVQFKNGEFAKEELWSDIAKQFGVQVVESAPWFTPWFGNDSPLVLSSPPNLLANVLDGRRAVTGVLRLCWSLDDAHQFEIRFQGTGVGFRKKVEKICEYVGGELIEGPPG